MIPLLFTRCLQEENSFLKVPSSGQNPCDVESLFSAITLGAEDLATEVNTSRDILLSAKNVVLSPGVNSISMASEVSWNFRWKAP